MLKIREMVFTSFICYHYGNSEKVKELILVKFSVSLQNYRLFIGPTMDNFWTLSFKIVAFFLGGGGVFILETNVIYTVILHFSTGLQ